jgi:NitT/TauT family transport system ATP-binding protein
MTASADRRSFEPALARRSSEATARGEGTSAPESGPSVVGLQRASSSGAMPAIDFAGVSLAFAGGSPVLDDITLSVRRGELVSLVGPSGCGKSTLLRLVARFLEPSAGSVSTRTRGLGYVFQEPTLLPWRSVLENVELPAALSGAAKAARRERARAVIAKVGLAGFEGHRPAELSGGMRMRVSIARALMLEPDVFLFDEPFAALDEITRERLHEQLVALFAQEPFAGLFVTHSVPEAVFLSTRVVVMSRGPGRIAAEFEVPFAWPRAPELRYRPEFAALAGRVSAALRQVAG